MMSANIRCAGLATRPIPLVPCPILPPKSQRGRPSSALLSLGLAHSPGVHGAIFPWRKTGASAPKQGKVHAAASDGSPAGGHLGDGTLESKLAKIAQQFTNLFPVWVVIAGAVALIHPPAFDWFEMSYVTTALAFSMLGMGFTMKVADFTAVFTKAPQLLMLGMAFQFTMMPLIGFCISRYMGLEKSLAVGICILASCPGGTASNIVAYIAKGEMGLSILMTAASTMGAIVMTPFLTTLLAGTLVPVNPSALLVSTLQVVLAPVTVGVICSQQFPAAVARIAQFSPAFATLLIAFIVGSTLSHNAEAALRSGVQLFTAVATLHIAGFIIGYGGTKALGLSNKIARTNSIEVGMQNATLGAVLAGLHFADPLVAAPCAVSSCTQSIMGSLIAAYWRATVKDDDPGEQATITI